MFASETGKVEGGDKDKVANWAVNLSYYGTMETKAHALADLADLQRS